ncbi:type II toxin-antitoxin system VapC family toxin [Rivularia sp. UHCC 0363]|uniref:type II toxin-antitoxin system VapC family toxin n=1 Tax=Rivularia sp. UHCC 0363 TaxID=3110244 RepID=UPI002B1FB18B|nr:PIN domain-containing protein [Rivularia sp. UHCC 0363]MEA5595265.1 PIN domain-containing protein [Rivularia sp. UHCC 0363]
MSQVIIIDTHIWIWFIFQEFERFPASWREVIETTDTVGISPVSCYEVALAQQKGRLQLPCNIELWLQEALEPSGITLFPITAQIAHQAVNLSPVHKDPFDRLIIATTIIKKAKLASIDGLFSKYSELDTYLMK